MRLEFIDQRLVDAVGWALLHLLWQGTLVALLLAATLSLLRKQAAAVRYVVSCGALVLVTILPVLSVWNSYATSESKLGGAVSMQPSAGTPTGSFPLLELSLSAVATGNEPASPFIAPSVVHQVNTYLPLIVTLWMVGVFIASSRIAIGWMRLRRLATLGVAASPEWQHALARLTRRIRLSRPVRLLESAMVEVPTVIGWLRPVVLLPMSALTGLSRQQLETILAHELAHIRRHDFIVNLFQAAVETLLFYHPAVWWISSKIRVEREHCCDDLAVELCGNPLLYARALADLEETRFPSAATALALNGGPLLHRVRRLISDSPRKCSAQWLAGVSVMTVAATLAIAAPLSLMAISEFDGFGRDLQSAGVAAEDSITIAAPDEDYPDEEEAVQLTENDDDEAGQNHSSDEKACDSEKGAPEWTADFDAEDSADSEETAELESGPAVIVDANRIAARAIEVTPAISARIAQVAAGMPLLPDDVGALLGRKVATAIAYAFPAPPPAPMAPQAVVLPAPQVRPAKPVKAKAPKAVVAMSEDFDFDFEFEFEFEFEGPEFEIPDIDLDLDLSDVEVVVVGAERQDSEKPLNRAALTVDDLIRLKAVGVSPAYIEELEKAGYRDLSIREITALRNAGVTASDVTQFRSLGLTDLSARDLARLRMAGVNAAYVKEIRSAGYPEVSARDLIRLRHAGVDADFVREAADLGGKKPSVNELIKLRHLGITRKFVEDLNRAGYGKLPLEDVLRWRATGVTPEFAQEMKAAGFASLTAGELIALRTAGVTAEFVRSLRDAGMTELTPRAVIRLRHAGVDAEFIRQMKKGK